MLVDVPLPPFVDPIQRLDFVEHDDEQYRDGLRKLVAGILGHRARNVPDLPAGVEVPSPPADALPTNLRRGIVEWLVPQVGRKLLRGSVADALGISEATVKRDWTVARAWLLRALTPKETEAPR